ncbi:hypothetical protein BS47DRAFT_1022936 [Hydnum rufescens UP504]|uniref:Multiple myeloma tumor-associated protein 2-like N-terminal domain-containing protein n=1 Tax=Hydnum rufescens UP504 TaxID=1448309 RepID=A0A9P6DWL9_9AGAM|nr:hypothetical protein BS47DRAFT_1022936 [Hydnum rufescens UP504]
MDLCFLTADSTTAFSEYLTSTNYTYNVQSHSRRHSGGQGDFTWAEVSADKDRENYLGHSINAPTGRWQKNKDIHWYKRDVANSESDRLEEIRKIKEAEADALAVALLPRRRAPLVNLPLRIRI